MKRPYRVGALGAGLVAAALLAAGCGTGGVASAGQPPDTQSGQQLFTQSCGSCHALSAAGTSGTIGPNLDHALRQSQKDGIGQSTIQAVVRDQIAYAVDRERKLILVTSANSGEGRTTTVCNLGLTMAKAGAALRTLLVCR